MVVTSYQTFYQKLGLALMAKNYLIVGGSSGIGFELTKQLSIAGNQVTVLSRTEGELSTLQNVNHIAYDVTGNDVPDISMEAIDGFVYCPGTINLKPFHGLKLHDFQYDFDVNVKGAIKTLQSVIKPLKKAESPAIVFFSTVAVQQGMAFHSSVAASKGAIEGLTRSLAAELAPSIRVNCIAPSLTDTPLASKFLASEEKRHASAKRHALNRIGTAQEIAKTASYLLSDNAGWITGQVIGVDGGMSAIKNL